MDVEESMPLESYAKEKPSDILIVSHHTLDANYLKYTWENHRAYAKTHGYDYWFRNGVIDDKYVDNQAERNVNKKGLYWQKIATVRKAMELTDAKGEPRYKWIMWIDADALFTNFTTTIEEKTANLKGDDFLVIAEDYKGICANTGIWIIRNDAPGRHFIRLVDMSFPHFKDKQFPEQMAVVDLIFGYLSENDLAQNRVTPYQERKCEKARIIKGVQVLRQREMNAYYVDYAKPYPESSWHAGDYIAHAAAGGNKLKFIKRLTSCMAAKGNDLTGCEVDGSFQENSAPSENRP
jgi:hypothetical protein